MTSDHPTEAEIGAFLDAELPDLKAQALAAHLNGCAICSALASDIRSASISLKAARVTAPPGMRDRLRAALAAEANSARAPGLFDRLFGGWDELFGAARRAIAPAALALAVVAALSSSLTWLALGKAAEPSFLTHDLMTAHLRALAQNGAIQVASSDQHTVKPWFAGKVDFSPDARDLSAEGFTLVGGRLDVVDGRRVGALVYRRRLHLIDVFAWPAGSTPPAAPALLRERGYGLLSWTKNGVSYWAVSDLDPEELKRLADLL